MKHYSPGKSGTYKESLLDTQRLQGEILIHTPKTKLNERGEFL